MSTNWRLCVCAEPRLCSVAGEYLTERVRSLTFRAILKQEVCVLVFVFVFVQSSRADPLLRQVSLFDHKKYSAPALAARLSGDAALVQARLRGGGAVVVPLTDDGAVVVPLTD